MASFVLACESALPRWALGTRRSGVGRLPLIFFKHFSKAISQNSPMCISSIDHAMLSSRYSGDPPPYQLTLEGGPGSHTL